jgi:hypothetical protein
MFIASTTLPPVVQVLVGAAAYIIVGVILTIVAVVVGIFIFRKVWNSMKEF